MPRERGYMDNTQGWTHGVQPFFVSAAERVSTERSSPALALPGSGTTSSSSCIRKHENPPAEHRREFQELDNHTTRLSI